MGATQPYHSWLPQPNRVGRLDHDNSKSPMCRARSNVAAASYGSNWCLPSPLSPFDIRIHRWPLPSSPSSFFPDMVQSKHVEIGDSHGVARIRRDGALIRKERGGCSSVVIGTSSSSHHYIFLKHCARHMRRCKGYVVCTTCVVAWVACWCCFHSSSKQWDFLNWFS
jgi:hypothetical protein